MPMRRMILPLVVLVVFGLGVGAGWLLHGRGARRTVRGAPGPAPVATWQMCDISVSPDGALVAVRWGKRTPSTGGYETWEFRVALYELASGQRLSPAVRVYAGLRPGYIGWSPKGDYFACLAGENNLAVFARDGSCQTIDEKEGIYTFLWMPEHPDTLLFPLDALGASTYETFRASTGAKARRTGPRLHDLFPLHGATCGSESFSSKELRITEFRTGKTVLRMPDYSYESWDGQESMMLSPDGRYLQLAMWASGSAFVTVARTADAGRVLADKRKALYWHDTISGGNSYPRILWPTATGATPMMREVIFLGTLPLEVRTGSTKSLLLGTPGQVRSLDYWYGYDDYLLVEQDGLYSYAAHRLPNGTVKPALPLLPGTVTDRDLGLTAETPRVRSRRR